MRRGPPRQHPFYLLRGRGHGPLRSKSVAPKTPQNFTAEKPSMINPPPKLIAFDLDGTLTESKSKMSEQMGELVAKLLQKMPVAIMSGADFTQFEKQFLPVLAEKNPPTFIFFFLSYF